MLKQFGMSTTTNECDKVNMPFEQMMENKYDNTYRDDLGYQVLKSS